MKREKTEGASDLLLPEPNPPSPSSLGPLLHMPKLLSLLKSFIFHHIINLSSKESFKQISLNMKKKESQLFENLSSPKD